MGMKLLPKSEVDRLKAVEKKTEIDEGLKLARRVDNLREVAAQEEASLESFRRETVASIHEEITPLVEERDNLKSEVRTLQAEREEARKPLDEEWLKVADAKAEVDRRGEATDARDALLDGREHNAREAEATARNLLQTATSQKELSSILLSDTQKAKNDAEAALKSAQAIEEAAKKVATRREGELDNREQLVAGRESSATIREADIITREKELVDGWRLLNDRIATFERTLKRKS